MLNACSQDDPPAAEKLLPLVYRELRALAAHKLSMQPPGQTLQATALVHEAYLKLVGNEQARWSNHKHFFAAAAEAMRHILIDRARRRARTKHGQNAEMVALDQIEMADPVQEDILLLLNDALEEFKGVSPERAEIVNLRFFAGLSEPEIAEILDISERSVQRHWAYSKAWLFERIEKMQAN